ncbi:unnamed protein product [Paramecium sonneborni]|uniref:Uncharacterized protein n=1 Tax=Paramecium sonneborni TaxID=65129 RepID=A0A8S1RNV9_9CILI|nr:unnamed protein product [Paramecium sonneborni]
MDTSAITIGLFQDDYFEYIGFSIFIPQRSCQLYYIRYCDALFNQELCFILKRDQGNRWKNNKSQMISCTDHIKEMCKYIFYRQQFLKIFLFFCMWNETY